jgi:hypothetical protein
MGLRSYQWLTLEAIEQVLVRLTVSREVKANGGVRRYRAAGTGRPVG